MAGPHAGARNGGTSEWPRTGWARTAPRVGRFSSAVRASDAAARASSRCPSLVAPTIGAVTPGLGGGARPAPPGLPGRPAPPPPRPPAPRRRSRWAGRRGSCEVVGVDRVCAPLATAGPVAASTPRAGAPRDEPTPLVDALGDHLPLLLPVDQVVVVLHRDEPGSMCVSATCWALAILPGVHARGADVAALRPARRRAEPPWSSSMGVRRPSVGR